MVAALGKGESYSEGMRASDSPPLLAGGSRRGVEECLLTVFSILHLQAAVEQ